MIDGRTTLYRLAGSSEAHELTIACKKAFMVFSSFALVLGNFHSSFLVGQDRLECGLYALVVAAEAVNRPIDSLEFFSDPTKPGSVGDYMDGIYGSSAEQLIEAGKAHGLQMMPINGWTIQGLRSSVHPVILHLGRRGVSARTGHWITYLGEKDGKAYIYDVSRAEKFVTVDYGLLSLDLSGLGIVVGDGSIKKASLWAPLLFSHIGFLSPFLAVMVGGFLIQMTNWMRERIRLQILAIVVFPAIWVYIESTFDSNLPTNQQLVTDWISSKHIEVDFPVVNFEYVEKASLSGRVRIVDTRALEDYEDWHIPNAIHLSVGANFNEFQSIVSNWDRTQKLMVYCATDRCTWSTIVARRLWVFGFKNVCIYEAGAVDFFRKSREREL